MKIAEHMMESQRESTAPQSSPLYRPILLDSLKGYGAAQLRTDLIAGIIVGIVALPLSIALAIAVGAGPQAGLYTAIVGGAVAALFGGSQTQVTGPTAAFIVILAPIYAQHGPLGLMAAGLLAGIMLVLMGVSGLGSLVKYVPYPVTTGFTTGIAVTIATIQIKDLFGLQVHYEKVEQVVKPMRVGDLLGDFVQTSIKEIPGLPDHFHEKLAALWHGFLTTPPPMMIHTGTIGVLTLAVLVFYPKILPSLARRVPGPLVAVVVAVLSALALSRFLGWNDVATIGSRFGAIPQGLPAFNVELFTKFHWSYASINPLIMPAVAIAMLGAIESLLSAVVADGMAGTKHNSNSELIGQGLANIASPLFGGIAATGAIARTTTNVKNGGRTPLAAFFHALTLLLIMLVAAPYASYIPMAALGAILLMVAYNMAELKHFRHILRAPKSDVLVLLACFLLTVFTDMVVAVVIGMILAAILFMRRMSELSNVQAVVSVAGDREMASHDIEIKDIPRGVMMYSVDGPFFFGACEKAITAMETIGENARVVIMRLNRVPAMDATGLYALEKIYEHLERRHITLVLSNVRAQPRSVMANAGFIERVGTANVAPDIEWALVRAYEVLGPAAADRRTGTTQTMKPPLPPKEE